MRGQRAVVVLVRGWRVVPILARGQRAMAVLARGWRAMDILVQYCSHSISTVCSRPEPCQRVAVLNFLSDVLGLSVVTIGPVEDKVS